MNNEDAKVYMGGKYIGTAKIGNLITPIIRDTSNIDTACMSYLLPRPGQRINAERIDSGARYIWNEHAQVWELMASFRGWGRDGMANCYFVAPASFVNIFYQKYKHYFTDIYLKGTTGHDKEI